MVWEGPGCRPTGSSGASSWESSGGAGNGRGWRGGARRHGGSQLCNEKWLHLGGENEKPEEPKTKQDKQTNKQKPPAIGDLKPRKSCLDQYARRQRGGRMEASCRLSSPGCCHTRKPVVGTGAVMRGVPVASGSLESGGPNCPDPLRSPARVRLTLPKARNFLGEDVPLSCLVELFLEARDPSGGSPSSPSCRTFHIQDGTHAKAPSSGELTLSRNQQTLTCQWLDTKELYLSFT